MQQECFENGGSMTTGQNSTIFPTNEIIFLLDTVTKRKGKKENKDWNILPTLVVEGNEPALNSTVV